MSKAIHLLNKLPPEQAAKVKELVARRLFLDEMKRRQEAQNALSPANSTNSKDDPKDSTSD